MQQESLRIFLKIPVAFVTIYIYVCITDSPTQKCIHTSDKEKRV